MMPSTKGRPYIIVTAECGCKHCKRGAQYGIEGPEGVQLGTTYGDRGEAAHFASQLTLAYRAGQHTGKAEAQVERRLRK